MIKNSTQNLRAVVSLATFIGTALGATSATAATIALGSYDDTPQAAINQNLTPGFRAFQPDPALRSAAVGDTIIFTSPDGIDYSYQVTSAATSQYNNHVIVAQGDGENELFLAVNAAGEMAAEIVVKERPFTTDVIQGDTILFALDEVTARGRSPEDFRSGGSPVWTSRDKGVSASRAGGTTQSATGETVIDMGFLYGPAIRDNHDPRAIIDLALAYANTQYRRAGLDITFRAVGEMFYDFSNPESMEQVLNEMSCAPDGCFAPNAQPTPAIDTWRNSIGADMVASFVGRVPQNGTLCGLADTPSSFEVEAIAYRIFSTTAIGGSPYRYKEFPDFSQNPCGMAVFAHEVGHNFGLFHDAANNPGGPPNLYPYGIGFQVPGSRGSIMSYVDAKYQKHRFSSPNVLIDGQPLGEADVADAARALQQVYQNYDDIAGTVVPVGSPPVAPVITDISGDADGNVDITLSWAGTQTGSEQFVAGCVEGQRPNSPEPEPIFSSPSSGLSLSVAGLKPEETYACVAVAVVNDQSSAESSAVLVVPNGTVFNTNLGEVNLIYIGLLGRAPDRDGLLYWLGDVSAGVNTIVTMRGNFVGGQEEYINTLGQLNRTDLVTALYRNLFGRDPDAAGLDYWVNVDTSPADAMVTQLVEGAKSNTTATEDREAMSNRIKAAVYYANFAANFSVADAQAVLQGVNFDPATLAAAIAKVDNNYR